MTDKRAQYGDVVKVHYTGKLEDGRVFDKTEEPIQFTLGESRIIPGFENAVVGMKTGDSQSTTIPAEQGFGPRHNELVWRLEREQLSLSAKPEVGQRLQLQMKDGESKVATIIAVTDDKVVVDANHPLAGENLVFDIQLVEINGA